MLKDGKIIVDGHQNKVINSENLKKLYGIQVEVTKNNGLWNINRLSIDNNYKNRYCNRFSLSSYFWCFSLQNIYEYN